MTTVYGIPNCDTVKKARKWLDAKGVAHAFHDYKKQGVPASKLEAWCDTLGWEKVINRSGTTFRKLRDADKADLDRAKAIALMMAQPSLIKRPIVEHSGGIAAGFSPEAWQRLSL